MFFNDNVDNLKITAAYAGGTISSDTDTAGGIAIDTQGYGSVTFAVYMGAITAGNCVVKVMETDNSNGTTDITECANYLATATFTKSPDLSNTVKKVGVVPTKRYVVLRLTTNTSANLVVKGAIAILGGAHEVPVA